MCWLRKDTRDYSQPLDDNQKEYREHFGIVDKFCIQMSMEDENGEKGGFIVFLDVDDEIDWVDLRNEKYWIPEDAKTRDAWIAQLNVVNCMPHTNVSKVDVFTFHKMLGAGYVLALQKKYEEIKQVLEDSTNFIIQRNKEAARKMYLEVSGIIALVVLVFWILDSQFFFWKKEWVAGTSMGILGAYVSVWIRYGKDVLTGLSSRWLHYLESVSRLFIGAIFAIVAMYAVKCGIILSNVDETILRYAFGLTGFAAGFSERFVPSMIERFVKSETENE